LFPRTIQPASSKNKLHSASRKHPTVLSMFQPTIPPQAEFPLLFPEHRIVSAIQYDFTGKEKVIVVAGLNGFG
jgi:hypothetical protein